jgi:ubiquinone biosynthesis protein COQ4
MNTVHVDQTKSELANAIEIEGYPAPPALPLRPVAAVRAVFRLMSNKEDTTQVFEISNALSRDSHNKLFARFAHSPYGKRVIEEPIEMENILSDFDRLRAMPEGSFGRTYLAFMESGGLTPDGLIDVAEESGIAMRLSEYQAYARTFMHMETTHDVWHVLTGYNRDALGELCLLEVSRVLTYNKAFLLITGIGGLLMKKQKRSIPIWAIRKEALNIGKAMAWLPEIDFEELLPLPLEEVREKLNIQTPVKYNAVPQQVKDQLLKPANDRDDQHGLEQAAE